MDGPGTISWENFVKDAENLAKLSKEISDHWQFVGNKEIPGQAYLTRREKKWIPIEYPIEDIRKDDEQSSNVENEEYWRDKLVFAEDPFEVSSNEERPLLVEHHVLWSMSYSVPVLYFNGWKSDFPGVNPISVEVAQRLACEEKLAYTELSQAIHPVLARPFLHLHACGSQELLKHTRSSNNRLVSWLSMVAPAALNLKIRQEYYELTAAKIMEQAARNPDSDSHNRGDDDDAS